MEKFVCIHGHFYQPPRENPWLESVEVQDSASPFHDWNERITVECYAPNATARILDWGNHISEITNNYSKISFNFGPTLLSWMKDKMPEIHGAIVAADKLSRERFSGHGSALAQVYNHMILPLANDADRFTQVFWGIRDFEYRFGRQPEGMWLSETAADIPTLETLAQLGIKFSILSPFQASRAKAIGKRNFRDVNGGRIDPTRPYLVRLPSGRSITVFFYDAPVSQAVAFERLLTSGERFAGRLMSAFSDQRQWDQLVNIATDGESYGHHHRYGEMALAYALHHIESNHLARLTNYGEFLERHSPTHEVEIHEKSSWSCTHGVGRWMSDCGCNSGGHPGWTQGWRTPLRQSLDWLRDELAPLFEKKASELLKDPWEARNQYVAVILDRSPESRASYFAKNAIRPLTSVEEITVLKLMELQRHAMLMYTSCGWFFDEVSGIESVQVVQYAARAIQLAKDLFDADLEPGFIEKFQGARSNIPENCDGRCIYEKFVKPAMIDWQKVTAHYAISSLFTHYSQKTRSFSFSFEDEHKEVLMSGRSRLVVGRTRIISEITQESSLMTYAILYLGEHSLIGGVRSFRSSEAYDSMFQDLHKAYDHADFPDVIRLIDRHFEGAAYSLRSLFKDEQRRIINEILASTRDDLAGRFQQVVDRYEPLMKFLQETGVPQPPALDAITDFVLHEQLEREIRADPLDFERLSRAVRRAANHGNRILDAHISFATSYRMERMIQNVSSNPEQVEHMKALDRFAELMMPLDLGLNLWKVQNTYWEMLQKVYSVFCQRASSGDEPARTWTNIFLGLGRRLGFAVQHLEQSAATMKLAA